MGRFKECGECTKCDEHQWPPVHCRLAEANFMAQNYGNLFFSDEMKKTIETITKNSKPLDSEISEYVDKNFWDLI